MKQFLFSAHNLRGNQKNCNTACISSENISEHQGIVVLN
ncbi:hypothetical protein SLEP1_g11113 [Rubroshorea leprosula]|uniref:Uncharacterized protein n=1 Tax=Rubroshorea leprosula TaxID=152421 RepID=A0AAV5IK41_9ROSI|nr:hypothetical protein SLEP1_g11113 [Rubroshorea leprosula]